MNFNILVVDDDTRIRGLLSKYLQNNGFRVSDAKDAETALQYIKEEHFDLLIIDVMMPGKSGIELTSEIRKTQDIPILILTALSETPDRISGLQAGADDYIGKPFDPQELLLRVNAILKRHISNNTTNDIEYKIGPLIFDPQKRSLTSDKTVIKLTYKESEILLHLLKNKDTTVTRQQLIEKYGDINERTIDVQITRLRKKLESGDTPTERIQTIRGVGYKLTTLN